MNGIRKLAIAVAGMKAKMPPTCHYLSAIKLVLDELDEAPAWNAETKYHRGDVVRFETVLYRAVRDVPRNGGCAPADQDYWEIVNTSTKEAVRLQVETMLRMCRNLCCAYDNLKALTGRLEREQGVEAPQFWCGEINTTGEPEKCRQCEILSRGVAREKTPQKGGSSGDYEGNENDGQQSGSHGNPPCLTSEV